MKITYFDAGSGIAGDMTIAALLQAGRGRGLTVDALATALRELPVGGYHLELREVEVGESGVRANYFDVVIDEQPSHDRDWASIRAMIESARGGALDDETIERALAIFEVMARAESKVHNVDLERVHFHEIGAIDSIVDVVGAAWCLERLGVEACFCGPVPSGSGFIDTEHGRLPAPTPATIEILKGLPVIAGDGEGELVTPTGAAILKAMAKPIRPGMVVEAVGYGAGTKRLADRPNVLRVVVGEADAVDDERIVVIEADVDDTTPVALAHACDVLRRGGARDVTVVPIKMKKNRLGMRMTVLCDLGALDSLARTVLLETPTAGLRYRLVNRLVLPRRIEQVDTEYGPVAVKVVVRPDGRETPEPEFDDVARAALARELPLDIVRLAALVAYERTHGK